MMDTQQGPQLIGFVPKLGPNMEPLQTISERRNDILNARFIDIRNLAYMTYRKPDNTPLMEYDETLKARPPVYQAVLDYEISQGWLLPDDPNAAPASQPEPQALGAPSMNMPSFPVNGAQNGAPAPMAQPGQQYAAPTQNGYAPVPVVNPMQAAGIPPPPNQMQQQMQQMPPQQPNQPEQQAAPSAAPASRGRGRPRAPTAAGPGPAPAQSAAPQPPGPQAAPAWGPPQGAPTPQFNPQAGMPAQQPAMAPNFQQAQAPGQQFQPQAFNPGVPQQAPAPMQAAASQQHMSAPAAAPQVDLTPLLQRLDSIGKSSDALMERLASVEKQLVESRATQMRSLVALHHLYLVNPQLAGNQAPNMADAFGEWLAKYLPQVPQ